MIAVRSLGTGFALSILSAFAHAGVIVVDASGGGAFTNIPPAVAAAQDGDTILVKAGAYTGFTVSNKSLSIVAESGAVVTVAGRTEILGLAAHRTVVLAGLQISGTAQTMPRIALLVTGNAGAVRAQACSFTGRHGDLPGSDGVVVDENAGGVAFVDCTFRGGDGGDCDCFDPPGYPGGNGLLVTSSLVALYDCDLHGGTGAHGDAYGSEGGAGCRLLSSPTTCFVHASGSTFRGGDGGDVCDTIWCEGGQGGTGLFLESGAFAWFLDSVAQGGAAGQLESSPVCNGVPGVDGYAYGGSGTTYPLVPPKLQLEAPALARESTDVPLTVTGRPGDTVNMFVSTATTFVGIPSWRGVRMAKRTRSPELVMILETIPPSGVLTTGIRLPALPPGVPAQTFFLQAWRNSSLDGRTLGSFAALTVVDSAF